MVGFAARHHQISPVPVKFTDLDHTLTLYTSALESTSSHHCTITVIHQIGLVQNFDMASRDSTIPTTTTGNSAGAQAGAGVADKIKAGVKGIHVGHSLDHCREKRS